MALLKYKVLQTDVKDGTTYIPEKAIPLSVWPDALGHPLVAFLMKYADWAEEFPDEAKKEVEEERMKASGPEEKNSNVQ